MRYLSQNLRSLREYFRFSQRDIAEAGDVKQPLVVKFERGEKTPSLRAAKGIADLFGVTIDEMINTPPDKLIAAVDGRERKT